MPVAPVLRPEQVIDDPQIKAREFIETRQHPVAGRYLSPKPPASMFGSDVELSPAPMLGEQSTEILAELGYEKATINAYLDNGVIKTT